MDKRKNNGGHSTKATKPTDKRLNVGRKLVNEWREKHVTLKELTEMMEKIKSRAIGNNDMKAAQLWLEYAVNKPDQRLDLTTTTPPTITLNLNEGD